MMNTKFEYNNVETKIIGGVKIIRKVTIKNGKGYKSVTTAKKSGGGMNKTRKNKTSKKILSSEEMNNIKEGKFIKGLFTELQD